MEDDGDLVHEDDDMTGTNRAYRRGGECGARVLGSLQDRQDRWRRQVEVQRRNIYQGLQREEDSDC